LNASRLDPDFSRVLVVPQSKEDRLTEATIRRPLAEFDFDNELRAYPVRLLVCFGSFLEWRFSYFEWLKTFVHVFETLPREAAAGMPGVNEAVVVEVA